MESRAKVAGHPIHPILVVFPLGLFATAIVFDILYLITKNSTWTETAYYMIAAGIVGGLVAAPFGWIDWFGIPRRTRAKRIGLLHGLGNMVVLALFLLSWVLRRDGIAIPPTEAIVAALAGGLIAVITGWLGGELVGRLGVGVDDGAHLDAPSSLSKLPAGVGAGMGAAGARTMASAVDQPWTGRERRVNPVPAYVGVERRRANFR